MRSDPFPSPMTECPPKLWISEGSISVDVVDQPPTLNRAIARLLRGHHDSRRLHISMDVSMPDLLVLAFIPLISTSGLVLPPPPTECFTSLTVTNKQSKHYYIDVAYSSCGWWLCVVVRNLVTLGSKQEWGKYGCAWTRTYVHRSLRWNMTLQWHCNWLKQFTQYLPFVIPYFISFCQNKPS